MQTNGNKNIGGFITGVVIGGVLGSSSRNAFCTNDG